MERRAHGMEFKREAVRLALQPGVSRTQVAKELGIHVDMLRYWIRQLESAKWETDARLLLKSAQQQGLERLRRKLKRVETQRDSLKKALAHFAKEPK